MPPIPEHIIDRIRESSDIVDVVGRYVSLKKKGQNYFGLCPFHQEKTPSFSVNPAKQIFHCFGCGVGGNVFTFLVKYEKISFVDAVKRLAEEAGIEIPVSREVKRQESENEQLYKANQIACNFFQRQLQNAPDSVRAYLDNRGISPETVELFKIGYAPDRWDSLLNSLQRFGYPVSTYKKLGLILENEQKTRQYDRFRNRLIFPIMNQSGKVVGFGGRALGGDENTPKYINSPESSIYQKSQVLYGLHLAYQAIRSEGKAILVEGYMDMLQLYQQGIRNVVATSGTSLTEAHARLIRRYTHRVVLCYDADTAGVNAALRGGEILFQQLLDVNVLILPAGEDPDSYVKQYGAKGFTQLLEGAREYLTFRLGKLSEKYDLQTAADRSRAVGEIVALLSPIQDNVRLSFYVEKAAEQLHLPATLLLNEIRKLKKRARQRESLRETPPPEPETTAAPLTFTGAWGAEKDIILLLIAFFEDIHEYVFNHVSAEDFLNPEFRDIFKMLSECRDEPVTNVLHHILDKIENDEVRSLLIREIDLSNREFQKPEVHLRGCIKQIKLANLQAKIDVIRRKLMETPAEMALLKELQQASNELKRWQAVNIHDV